VEEAIRLAGERGAEIQYDNTVEAPFFVYTENGEEHRVWFEDARSLSARLRLLPEYGLRGALYWNFDRPNPQNLALINQLLYSTAMNLW
jgi:spore germination protein